MKPKNSVRTTKKRRWYSKSQYMLDFDSAEMTNIVKTISNRIKVIDVPISQIHIDVEAFQNRDEDYCLESIDKLKQAVYDGTFNWAEFDAILLWQNPSDNNLYVLAGHSRNKAFNELADEGRKDFEAIPSKIIKEITKAKAQEIAKNSNCLNTKETDSARAKYYREKREGGTHKRDILKVAKLREDRNAKRIIALSYLNREGKAMTSFKAFEKSGGVDCVENIAKISKWIGEARQKFGELTNAHEDEFYEWLMDKNIFKKIFTEQEFLARVGNITNRLGFDAKEPLNLLCRTTKTHYDIEYEQQIADKNREITDQLKIIDNTAELYNNEGITPERVAELLKNENTYLYKLKQDLAAIEQQYGSVKEANKRLLGLFDNISSAIAE